MWERWFSQQLHRPCPCTTCTTNSPSWRVHALPNNYRRSHTCSEKQQEQRQSPPRPRFATPPPRQQSSWDAKEAGGGRNEQADYLYELGASQQYNINVSHGQNVAFIDSLFTGNTLGHETDIADGSLRGYEFRTLNNIVGMHARAMCVLSTSDHQVTTMLLRVFSTPCAYTLPKTTSAIWYGSCLRGTLSLINLL